MVKKNTPDQLEQIAIATGEAEKLTEECRFGAGSPIETRIAAALLESAQNIKAQSQALEKLSGRTRSQLSETKNACMKAEEAATRTEEAIQAVSAAAEALEQTKADLSTMQLDIIQDATETFRDEFFEALAFEAKTATENALATSEKLAKSATAHIEQSEAALAEAQVKLEKTSKEFSGLAEKAAKLTPHKALLVAVLVAIVFSAAVSARTANMLSPIINGGVVITYDEDYKTTLKEARAELKKAQNELEAYKDAYPEGLSEQRLHDLNEKNAKVSP